ncbi:hypothetical protein LBMAG42_30730 [Deltaproteobacteria bacterium]|nr:hypothetical protein LBMAG42_30730 [Deltaproteobacteria bacterium]
MFLAWFAASAVAAELLAWVPAGVVHAGERVRVGLYCVDCGAILDPSRITVSGGTLSGQRANVDGTVWADVTAGLGERIELQAQVAGVPLRASLPLRPLATAPLTLSVPTDAALTDGSVEVQLTGLGPLTTDDVVLRASEGTVGPPRATPTGLAATVTFTADRIARPLLIGALDLRTPGSAPIVSTVRLRARHSGSVSAEKGSRLTLRIGARSFGPFVAGEDGTVNVAFESAPGENTYELLVADDLGNTQKLTQAVPNSTRPVLLAIDGRAELGRQVWLAAADARGAPWAGPAPTCRSGVGSPDAASEVGKARWRWEAPDLGSPGELPVGCTLGETSVMTRLSPAARVPAAIALRFYPDVLSADFPLAEVQASLIDAVGDRLPPVGLELSAARGTLRTTVAGDLVRGEYDGTAAAALGEDEIHAQWRLPTGEGAPARVELCTGKGEGGVVAVARVLDRAGRPLVGRLARALVDQASLGDDLTDARGYVRWTLPAGGRGARIVAVSAEAARSEVLAIAGSVGAGCVVSAAPDRADLDARVRVPIRSGRVRQVFLEIEPRTLTLGPGATAEIRVRMLDSAGALVGDEPLTVQGSEGVVSAPVVAADGSLVAVFTPGAGAAARDVHITATTSAGTVATTLTVAPRPVRGMVSAGFGWVDNFSSVSSPFGSLSVDQGLPVPGLSLRLGAGVYGVDSTLDSSTGPVRVTGNFFPFDAGISLFNRGPRLTMGAGISLVLIPYSLSADFGGSDSFGGAGLAPPGVEARGSAGWRLGQTELYAEVGYLLFTAPNGAVSVAQNAGGVHVIVGYRLLY